MVEPTAPAKPSEPRGPVAPSTDDQSSPVVRGAGALLLAGGVLFAAVVGAVLLYASGMPSLEVMQRCTQAGGSGGGCGGNSMAGPALLVVVAGFGAAGWIWRRR